MARPFNVMAVFALARDRLYRVYYDADTLYFIRIGGQFAYKNVTPNPALGLAGVIPAGLAAAERIMEPERIAELDRTPPRDVLGQHKHDMAIPLADIVSSSLEPRSFFSGHDSHVGRWLVTLSNRKKWKFQFVETDQMKIAVETLPELLQDKVQVRVRWDASRQKFEKAS